MARHPADIDLEETLDDEFAFWPLNLVLVLLGTTILGVAFYYLDVRDTRIVHNPWTYAVLTPLVLFVLSVALQTIVSRLVQKSMQMAFLLSVLVHLFLLIGAMNIVIFSRMWPDLIESLARERHQLKRESLQAKQYVSVTSSRSSQRPDYLRHVPTTHEPTEIQHSDPPSLNLARSTVAHLVTPTPKLERTANPHLVERQTPQPTQPAITENPASLSRSDLQRQIENRAVPYRLVPALEANPTPSLQPTRTTDRRGSRAAPSARVAAPQEAQQQPPSNLANRAASRAAGASSVPPSAEASQIARQLVRDRRLDSHQREFTMPSPPSVETAAPTMAEVSPQPAANSQSPTQRRTVEASSVAAITAQPEPLLPANVSSTLARRRAPQRQVPAPAAGHNHSPLARSTAGGEVGLPAASSMPLQGSVSMAAEASSNSPLVSPRMATRRRSSEGRAPASLPDLGAPTAPSWNSQPAATLGVAGRSPAELAQDRADGEAASPDVAGLAGAGPSMSRAVVGLPGSRGPLAAPEAIGATDSSGSSQADGSQVADARLSRRRASETVGLSPGPTLPSQAATEPQSSAGGSQTTPSLPQVDRALGAALVAIPTAGDSSQSAELQRSSIAAGPPSTLAPPDIDGTVERPAGANQGTARTLSVAEDVAPRRRSSGTTPLLALNEPLGPGGVGLVPNRAGDLVPRRSPVPESQAQPDFTMQRFERQAVGGPLAAGRIAVPKPAFQQRLERLQDRNPLDLSAAEPATELAIERGLAFLAKHQNPNGCWRLQDFDTRVLMTSDTAATGLALLAFQGAGYTHKQFKYADTVDRAIQFLRQSQLENGDLYVRQDPASDQNAWLYSHAIAALALCEAYGMTQDPELQEPAQRAIDFMVAGQDRQFGGWRYRPGTGSDTSVSGWFMMAFESAELAGLTVPPDTLRRMQEYLEKSQVVGSPHLYRYNPYAANTPQQRHGLQPTAVMTSVGLLMRLYSGWQRELPALQQGAAYLASHPPEHGTPDNSRRDTYYWYYATQVMFHMGGDTWQNWHDQLYPLLIRNQVLAGENAGSWDPFTPTPDLWARYGGRLYVTTLNLLSLEVSYRHLPLYDATGAPE